MELKDPWVARELLDHLANLEQEVQLEMQVIRDQWALLVMEDYKVLLALQDLLDQLDCQVKLGSLDKLDLLVKMVLLDL